MSLQDSFLTTIDTIETTLVIMYVSMRSLCLYAKPLFLCEACCLYCLYCRFNNLSCHANIVQRVKSCYKIKTDYRVLDCCFYGILLRCCPHNIQEKPLFRSNSNPIRVKERLFCMAIEAVLECKSGSKASQRCLFGSAIHCTLLFLAA